VLREPGAVAEARASGADGTRVSRVEAHRSPHRYQVAERPEKIVAVGTTPDAVKKRGARKSAGDAKKSVAKRRPTRRGVTVGQKVHPFGFRLGFNKTWRSRWYSNRDYAKLLHEDLALLQNLKKRFAHAGVSKIETERAVNRLKIDIYTRDPASSSAARAPRSTS